MKIFFAGNTLVEKREDMVLDSVENRLLTFYYIREDKEDVFKSKYSFDEIAKGKKDGSQG